MKLHPFLLMLLCAIVCHGAPMPPQELLFLIRQRTPDAEIIHAVTQRRLLIAIDAAAEQALRDAGASEALVAALRKPELALSITEARTEVERLRTNQMRVSQSATEDAAAHAQQLQRQQQASALVKPAVMTRQMLDGLLVRLDGDQLKPFDARSLEGVRVFGFYYSAMWCGPCRKFMPTLIERYQRLKAQYPGQFELIFVSSDRDEFNMAEYMRTYRMPWPAVRFGAATPAIQQFAGKSIPWLVVVSDKGEALTQNAVDKKYIPPDVVLGGIEELLGKLKR